MDENSVGRGGFYGEGPAKEKLVSETRLVFPEEYAKIDNLKKLNLKDELTIARINNLEADLMHLYLFGKTNPAFQIAYELWENDLKRIENETNETK